MESLIPVINELHDILAVVGEGSGSQGVPGELSLDLPEVAVVGSQSVGKSSLLEYIIGRHFLPRGQGIVTRRPLILQLQQIRQDGREDYAEFGHKKGLKFTDFDKVKEEILVETNRLVGENKNVSEVPILLRIFSKKAINLTLVDLPGLTKVPVEDQPSDIESQIRKIVLSYIRRPSCLILAITAANTDIANSDSLNIAREVDPEGARTIGVLSKLDTVENYATALQVLSNQSYPLSRGYVAVMCRDFKQKGGGPRSLRASLNEERSFFESNSRLKPFQSRCGTYNLVSILQKEFLDHILRLLPRIKSQSKKLIELKQMELLSYGDLSRSDILDEIEGVNALTSRALFVGGEGLSSDGTCAIKNKGAVILNCFSKFSRRFQDMIDGQASYQTGLMKLSGGARLNYVFHNWFGGTLFSFDPLDGLSDSEIRTAIKNSTGTKSSLFVSEGAFEVLARIQIKKLLRPSLTCVEQVYEELRMLVDQCSLPELSRYSNLKSNIISVVNRLLEECLGPTNRAVVDLINMELAYINTNHPDFIGGASALTSIFEKEKACLAESLSGGSSNERPRNPSSDPVLLDQSSNPATPLGRSRVVLLTDFFSDQQREAQKPRLASLDYAESENSSAVRNYRLGEAPHASSASRPPKNPCGGSHSLPATSSADMSSPVKKGQSQFGAKHLHVGSFGATFAEGERHNSGKCGGRMGLPLVPETIATSGDPSEREKIESDVIKFFIVSYFNIVRKNIADSVPKAIMYFMVNAAKDAIQRELVAKLYREEIFDDLLQEERGIVEKRQLCHRSIAKLSNLTRQLETLISNLDL